MLEFWTAIRAGAVTFFAPLATKIAIAGIITMLVAGGVTIIHFKHKWTQEGYDNAWNEITEQNETAAQRIRDAVANSRACRDRGMRWTQSDGKCLNRE